MELKSKKLFTDVLIIGGGIAGCYAGITLAQKNHVKVLITEQNHIKKMDNDNSQVEECMEECNYLSSNMKQRVNDIIQNLKEIGLNDISLNIEKEQNNQNDTADIIDDVYGKFKRENVKPILVSAVYRQRQIKVMNHVKIVDYILKGKKVIGAYGLDYANDTLYAIYAKAVICATGGRLSSDKKYLLEGSQSKPYYKDSYFGCGCAMGIRSGAQNNNRNGVGCGYCVEADRKTTLEGLYAAGSITNGCMQKYMMESLIEGMIAAESSYKYVNGKDYDTIEDSTLLRQLYQMTNFLRNKSDKQYYNDVKKKIREVYLKKIIWEYTNQPDNTDSILQQLETIQRLLLQSYTNNLYELMKLQEIMDLIAILKVQIKDNNDTNIQFEKLSYIN
ncbi:FAD-binding protein [Anaeromicropila herbilytica]|uniref:FAD/NAD(P)-binding domain-containing protein n=1 Tax=Anaeromicropila herbilytica TaxID=2785025 RepID=A0A7R7ENL4_9FIRM|nr:FAD-binding protein [Anaeromicropila herbilytica]BCN32175.1 hypothetical protein bsdtb5_34700 [Anaeromicropila herbilytica]